jgi:competence protein ComEC
MENSHEPQNGIPAQRCAMHPLAQLATAFAFGVLTAAYVSASMPLLLVLTALTTSLVVVAIIYRRLRAATSLIIFAIALTGLALATQSSRIPSTQLRSLLESGAILPGDPVELTGVLERDPEFAPERLYLQLRVEKTRSRPVSTTSSSGERDTPGVVMLLAPVSSPSSRFEFERLDLKYGARVRIMTLLERSDEFRNPGVSSFTEFLDRKGYDATGLIKSPLLIERLDNQRVFLPLTLLYGWRTRLQNEIDSRFSVQTAGILDAAVLGNRFNLSHATAERFREAGTFHVLVISGLHITFIGGLVLLLARRFTRKKVLQVVISMSVVWAYVLAVGAESSVVRAALMFTLVVLAPILARPASSLNALGGAALTLLALRPSDLFDPSFQLTFVSVLAIVVLAWPPLQKLSEIGSWRPTRETPYPPSCSRWLRTLSESLFWSEREGKRELARATYNYRLFKTPVAARLERFHLQRLLRYLFAAITVSVAVQLMLLPFLVVYFHRLSLASFVLNIGISVLMAAVAVIATFAMLLAQASTTLAAPFVSLANWLTWMMVHSVDPFSRVGVASLRIPEYTGGASIIYGLYYLPLLALIRSLSRWQPLRPLLKSTHRKRRMLTIAISGQLLLLTLVVVHPWSEQRPTGKLRVDFIDVGQGDSALVTLPDNSTLLIDGGGRPGPFKNSAAENDAEAFERETRSIGESVVSEYLWWRGLDHVDYLLATHADADHIDGLNDVAQNFKVRAALVARTPETDAEYSRFASTLARRGVPTRLIGAGDVLEFGQVKLRVLWPAPLADSNASSTNNDSIVLHLEYGERAVLLTGDIEKAGEEQMLSVGADLRADVIKVAHHGSKTSSIQSLIEAVRPRHAIISVGQASIFGHPNPEVVERWQNSGAQVMKTGDYGTITVVTDGKDLTVETFVKKN